MKPPREPKRWRYPRLYASFDKETGDLYGMRIIYPSGRGDYIKGWDAFFGWEYHPGGDYACWASAQQHAAYPNCVPIDSPANEKAANESRKQMFEYVRESEGVEPVYLGEIK